MNSSQLQWQVNIQLFERLLLSNNVQSVLAVTRDEKLNTEVSNYRDIPAVSNVTKQQVLDNY